MAKEVSEEERKRIEEMIDSLVERAKKASACVVSARKRCESDKMTNPT